MADSISGLTGAGGGSLMRITGMATGLDIDGMVKKMMLAEQAKVDKVVQEKQAIVWKQEIYQDIIKDIKDLQDTFFDVSDGDNYVKSSSYFSSADVTVNSADVTAISATAAAGAKVGTYSISFGGDGHLSTAAKIDGRVGLVSGSINVENWNKGTGLEAKKISFSINGGSDETITLEDTHADINSLKDDINAKIALNDNLKDKVQVVVINDKIQFQALGNNNIKISSTTVTNDLNNLTGKSVSPNMNTTMGDLGLTTTKTFKFNYNGATTDTSIEITKEDKISDIINKISNATNGEVKGSFSELTGKFTLETSKTGAAQSIKIIEGELSQLGLKDGTDTSAAKDDDPDSDPDITRGKDAVAYITPPGGTAVKVTKSTNNFTIDGISYNLLDKKDSSFTVVQNTQKLYDKIDGFLKKYNAIVDKIQTRLTEKKDLNYKPLTDTQKKEMKDDEIKAWEERAKKGVLKNDNNLQNLLSDLRSSFMTAVDGVSLKIGKYGTDAIGIDTGDPKDGGKINISNSEKLKNAIAQHGAELMNLFNKSFVADDAYNNITGTSEEDKKTKQQEYKFQHQGIFQRLDDILVKNVGYAKTIVNSAILTKYANKQEDFSMFGASGSNTLPDQIYRKDNKIKELNLKIKDKENALYQQFARLETVMNNYNSQSSWLAQQFGG